VSIRGVLEEPVLKYMLFIDWLPFCSFPPTSCDMTDLKVVRMPG